MDTHQRHFIYVTLGFLCGCMVAFSMTSPGKPHGLQVTKVENLNITLTWRRPLTTSGAPDNSTLTYIVGCRSESGDYKRLYASIESVQLDLLPDKRYDIQVRAIRKSIQGAWSQTLRVNSWDFVPAKPSNVRIVGVNGLRVDIAWEEPRETAQGILDTSILNYKVAYRETGRGGVRKQILTTTESASLFLRANTRYIVQVRAVKAFNSKVYGPWSKALRLVSNESVPSKPPSNVRVVSNSSSSIYISWGPIPEPDRNGVVRGYIVFYKERDSANWSSHDVKGALHWKFTGLVSGERYSLRVAGYTKEGNGPRSGVKSIIVAGLLASTTKKPATTTALNSPTTEKSTSTKKSTTNRATSFQTTLASETDDHAGQATTTIVKSGILKVPSNSTSTSSIMEENKEDLASSTAPQQTKHSTLPAVMARKGNNEAEENFLNKIILIGAPVGVFFLLLVVIILFFACRRKRARQRKNETDEIPLKTMTSSHKAKKAKRGVTRGEDSIRYEPPRANFTSTDDDPETEEHRSDQPMIIVQQPCRSVRRSTGEDPEYSETKNLLPVDNSQLENGSTSGLYESIGSLGGGGCDPEKKRDAEQEEEERYVTQDQIAAKRKDSQKNPAQAAPHEYSHLKAQPTNGPSPPEVKYENVRDSVHTYETLSFDDQRGPFSMNKLPMSSFGRKGNPSAK